MSKKSKYGHLVRIDRKLESSLREAKNVSDVISQIRSVNKDNPLMWGCYRRRMRYSNRDFVFTELITPGRNFISIYMVYLSYKKSGPAKITIFVDCNMMKVGKNGGNGDFRRELDVEKKDQIWEEAFMCFEKCTRNGHDMMSNFARR